jgi:hypothetical protein
MCGLPRSARMMAVRYWRAMNVAKQAGSVARKLADMRETAAALH